MALMTGLLQERKELEVNLNNQGVNRGEDPMVQLLGDFRESVIDNDDDY